MTNAKTISHASVKSALNGFAGSLEDMRSYVSNAFWQVSLVNPDHESVTPETRRDIIKELLNFVATQHGLNAASCDAFMRSQVRGKLSIKNAVVDIKKSSKSGRGNWLQITERFFATEKACNDFWIYKAPQSTNSKSVEYKAEDITKLTVKYIDGKLEDCKLEAPEALTLIKNQLIESIDKLIEEKRQESVRQAGDIEDIETKRKEAEEAVKLKAKNNKVA